MNNHYGMEYVTTKWFLCIPSHLLNNYGEWTVNQKWERGLISMGTRLVCVLKWEQEGGGGNSVATFSSKTWVRYPIFNHITWASKMVNTQVLPLTFWIKLKKKKGAQECGRAPMGLLWGKDVYTITLLITTGPSLGTTTAKAYERLSDISSMHPWLFMHYEHYELCTPSTSRVPGT